MIYLISPSKKMNISNPILENVRINEYTAQILEEINRLNFDQLKTKLAVNDVIAKEAFDMFFKFDSNPVSKAIFSYTGEQYRSINPQSMTEEELSFLNEHVRILSGLFGLVKPFDNVKEYRLPMETKLFENETLYQFWHDYMINKLKDEDLIINLSSDEYRRVIDRDVINYKNVVFKEEIDGKIRTVYGIKKVRGEFIRYIAQNHINSMEDLYKVNFNGFTFFKENKYNIIFIRKAQ